MAIETYDITTDLSDQDIYPSVLKSDALAAGLSTLAAVDANAAGNSNKVRFHFPAPLSAPDKTTLDGVVAAYDPANTQPVLNSSVAVILEDADASATERVWALTTDTATGTVTFGTCSDVGAPSDAAWEATRTGETVGLFDVKVPMAVAGAITVTGTVDGRDVAADGTALDDLATHASDHSDGGSDEIKIEDIGATSTDDTKVFGPDGSGGVEAKAVPAGVFGSELNLEKSLSQSSDTTGSYTTKVRLPASGDITLPTGTYLLTASYTWKSQTSNKRFFSDVLEGSTGLDREHQQLAGSTSSESPATRVFHRVLTAGDYNWSIDFRSQASGDVAVIWDARLSIWRLS